MKYTLNESKASAVIKDARKKIASETVVSEAADSSTDKLKFETHLQFAGAKDYHDNYTFLAVPPSKSTRSAMYAGKDTMTRVFDKLGNLFSDNPDGSDKWPCLVDYTLDTKKIDEIRYYMLILLRLRESFSIKSLAVVSPVSGKSVHKVKALLWIGHKDEEIETAITDVLTDVQKNVSEHCNPEWYYCGRPTYNPEIDRLRIENDAYESKALNSKYSYINWFLEIDHCMPSYLRKYLHKVFFKYKTKKSFKLTYKDYVDSVHQLKSPDRVWCLNEAQWTFLFSLISIYLRLGYTLTDTNPLLGELNPCRRDMMLVCVSNGGFDPEIHIERRKTVSATIKAMEPVVYGLGSNDVYCLI